MQNAAFLPANILLPPPEADLGRWAVLACDQFTSQPEYWQQVETLVASSPSTLRIILPEVYLEQPGQVARIQDIHAAMQQYRQTLLTRCVQGFVYVERQLDSGVRQGLVGCVDLEQYSYAPGDVPRIRPSEATVQQRIPPRLAVRRGATLESPHILMLCDDAQKTVIEPIAAKKQALPQLYRQPLMLGGGVVSGWAVTQKADIDAVLGALAALEQPHAFAARYGTGADTAPFALAVGDGNHSLATAKAAWQELKPTLTEQEKQTHPARYCLVELENIQSDAILLEPIHRVAFGLTGEDCLQAARSYCDKNGMTLRTKAGDATAQTITLVHAGKSTRLWLENAKQPLAAGTADEILQLCARHYPGLAVDYVHGDDAVHQLTQQNATGFLLPPLQKGDIFRGVALGGVLPKKTFSMGHATEKRYYLECRALC